MTDTASRPKLVTMGRTLRSPMVGLIPRATIGPTRSYNDNASSAWTYLLPFQNRRYDC